MSPKRSVTVYFASGEEEKRSQAAAVKMIGEGRVSRVRHNRDGTIRSIWMFRTASDPTQLSIRSYMGTAYTYRDRLPEGHRCWAMRRLAGKPGEFWPVQWS